MLPGHSAGPRPRPFFFFLARRSHEWIDPLRRPDAGRGRPAGGTTDLHAAAARARRPQGAGTLGADVVVIRLDEVTLARAEGCALEPVTLFVRAGEIVVLTGPRGAGKSSLLAIAAGALRPT